MPESTLRKPGEMFTASLLKKATPLFQFAFVMLVSILALLYSQYVAHSSDLVVYSGCFGLVFFVMFNPWLCLLSDNNKKYFTQSVVYYVLDVLVMYALIYLWTGKAIGTSWEVTIILITTTFYFFVAYGMMMMLKLFFVDVSDGGL
jgi:hypothetical protein